MKLYKHQVEALERTRNFNRVAYYHDMGLGKTFTGSEKLKELGAAVNLVVCQKSKIQDWLTHFEVNYNDTVITYDLTNKQDFEQFLTETKNPYFQFLYVGIINYDLVYRRPELLKLNRFAGFTLMLDESSLIQNEKTQRAKFIMRMQYDNLILLSGTPTSGRYERLYSQLTMLGYNIRKTAFFDMYVQTHLEKTGGWHGVPEKKYRVIDGYKNVDHLKRKMRRLGCDFLKTSEVMDLPQQQFIPVRVPVSKDYRKFCKSKIVEVEGVKLKGDYVLKELLYLRQLAGAYSTEKLQAFTDLLDSTDDGLIVFYNFEVELEKLKQAATDAERPISIINGSEKDLTAYNNHNNAVVLVQYQAGAMGLNLQKYNKIVYYTPPVSSELYEQSKKRIHRIGQSDTCFYYQFICTGSIEPDIYTTLEMRRNYTDNLFKQNYPQYFV